MALEIANVVHAIGLIAGGGTPNLLAGVGLRGSSVTQVSTGVYRVQLDESIDASEAAAVATAPAFSDQAPVCDAQILTGGVLEVVITSAGAGLDPPYFAVFVLRFRAGQTALPAVPPVVLGPGFVGQVFAVLAAAGIFAQAPYFPPGTTEVDNNPRIAAGGFTDFDWPIPAESSKVYVLRFLGIGGQVGSAAAATSIASLEGNLYVQRDSAGVLNPTILSTLQAQTLTVGAPSVSGVDTVRFRVSNPTGIDFILPLAHINDAGMAIDPV